MTLEKKLKNKYNGNYKKVFDKDFQQTVKRTDQSRRIFSRANITCANSSTLNPHEQKHS